MFALNRYGRGHIAAWCDDTSLVELLRAAPMLRYLGRVDAPRVASVGSYPCYNADLPGTYLGNDLPTRYVDAPALLAADWDVVILCGGPVSGYTGSTYGSIRIAWAPTFRAFVHDQGKGLLVSADYARNCASPPDLFDALNAITEPAGIVFSVIDLGYSQMMVDADCVPDFPK